ncbi:hypothetical protein N0V90_011932 [Kalmusia sp. IMI 367209]|nr:hypothetical protein N0V90_011932 [Kalmusia sp. IMI 367209]
MSPKFGGVARALGAVAALLPVVSAVPFGLQIYQCTKPGVIAPGFDDGPWIYSEDILDRWSHKDLATLTADEVKQEMILLEEAMVNILGYFPYYMRPPFLSVNAQALQVLKDLQYHVIIGDLNTKDWEYQSESGIETAKKLFTDGLDTGYTIVESHEQEVWTHGVLIDYMIEVVKNRGLKSESPDLQNIGRTY